jgi:transposase
MNLEQETDVAQLHRAIRLLEQENRKLIELNLELRAALAEAKGERAEQLELQIADLERQLAARNQAMFGDSSEGRPAAATKPEPTPEPKPEPNKGHGRRQQKLEVVEKFHELDMADKTCPSCGGELTEWVGQYEQSREIDMFERRFVELHHKRKKYRCACGGCVETAPAPLKLMRGARYSIDIAVSIAVAKYRDHMPLERLARALANQGLVIDSQTLWDQINALANVLSPVHDALQALVLSQSVIGADETHWKVMGYKSANGKTKRWQVWAISSPSAICYRIKAGRSLQDATDVLGSYTGIVVCDGYAVYDALSKQRSGLLLAHCWAHVRRKFIEVDPNHPEAHAEVLDLIDTLFEIERRARAGPDDSVAELLRLRQAESKPVVAQIQKWALAQQALPGSALGKAIAYMGSLWKGLKVFLENPAIPLHNNATERGLRGVVVGRKNHYGSRSQRGTEVAALFYSIVETAKLVGADPYDYLQRAAAAALTGQAIPLPQPPV